MGIDPAGLSAEGARSPVSHWGEWEVHRLVAAFLQVGVAVASLVWEGPCGGLAQGVSGAWSACGGLEVRRVVAGVLPGSGGMQGSVMSRSGFTGQEGCRLQLEADGRRSCGRGFGRITVLVSTQVRPRSATFAGRCGHAPRTRQERRNCAQHRLFFLLATFFPCDTSSFLSSNLSEPTLVIVQPTSHRAVEWPLYL